MVNGQSFRNDDNSGSTDTRDATQISLPSFDTSFWSRELARGFTGRQLISMAPGIIIQIVAICTGLTLGLPEGLWLGGVGFLAGSVVMFAGLYVALQARGGRRPMDRLRSLVEARKLTRTLPWSRSETIQHRIHGLTDLYANGMAEHDDGRLTYAIGISGRNTYGHTAAELDELISQFRTAIDEDIGDFRFRIFSTTGNGSDEGDDVVGEYEERATDDTLLTHNYRYLRELLVNVATWFRREDEPDWNARKIDHYLVVEVDASDGQRSDTTTRRNSVLEIFVNALNPFADSGSAYEELNEFQRRKEKRKTLEDRADVILNEVVPRVEGLLADPLDADAHARLLLNYWSGEEDPVDTPVTAQESGTRLRAAESEQSPGVWNPSAEYLSNDDGNGSSDGDTSIGNPDEDAHGDPRLKTELFGDDADVGPAAADASNDTSATAETDGGTTTSTTGAFSPSMIDAEHGQLRVGEELTKTFHIEEWPAYPESAHLEDVVTVPGVDMDICIHVDPEYSDAVASEVDQDSSVIGSEVIDRQTRRDSESREYRSANEIYDEYSEKLAEENTESWRVNAYVTVRAGPQRGLREMHTSPVDYDSLKSAQRQALLDDANTIKDLLAASPADVTPIVPEAEADQLAAFKSCSPNFRDEYSEQQDAEIRSRKLGGAVGATFPMCGVSIQESGGIDWGRNTHTGLHVKANPLERGTAPHIATLGVARSGKSYFVQKATSRWYGADPDNRTLILCDTQSEFDGVTKMCDGEHIVVDGSTTINPLDMHPEPEWERDAGGSQSAYRIQFDSIVQFFVGVIEAQGVASPGDYTATIEEALERTFRDAGIVPTDPDSLANESPTVVDLRNTLSEMANNPGRFTWGESDAEQARKRKQASQLQDKLSGFSENGKYSHLVGESEIDLLDDDIGMIYLDLQQYRDSADAEKAAMLQLMLTHVANIIRRRDGEKLFAIDEAHMLLHSEEMSEWLQKAAREVARFECILWFISQYPGEFVSESGQSHEDQIRAQCSTVQIFRTPRVDRDILAELGLNGDLTDDVLNDLTPAWKGRGFTTCLVDFQDVEGWLNLHVEASPFEDLVYNYTPREHGGFEAYIERNWGAVESPAPNYQ